MDVETAIEKLEYEWDSVVNSGFFPQLRMKKFDEEGFNRVLSILNTTELPDDDIFDRRFVEVVWFIPTFMRWQCDGWKLDGLDVTRLEEATGKIEMRLTTILGLP